jgi:hypothetical protein
MHTLEIDVRQAAAQKVTVGEDALSVDLADGRTITVPNRLVSASRTWHERTAFSLATDWERGRRPLAGSRRRYRRGGSLDGSSLERNVRIAQEMVTGSHC